MLDFDTALSKVLESITLLPEERVPLDAALGRVLRQPLLARRPLPEFDYSAMDGYAVRSLDLSADDIRLPVVGTSSAGAAPATLQPGTTMRIFTGGPVPLGADAIVMQEDVTNDEQMARFRRRPSPGDHIRQSGEDLEQGQMALPRGVRLNAFQLGLAASLDYAELLVSQRPRLSIVCTGDELRLPGSAALPGSIPESNGIALKALARAAGADVCLCPSTTDDPAKTRLALENALGAGDVVVTVGGVSVGDRDIVRATLESLGVATVFHKVAIKPGKPLYFGTLGDKKVLGLPGNPASAQVTFALFGMPLLRALQGMEHPLPQRVDATLAAPIRQKPGRRVFHRALLEGVLVTPLDNQASGAATGMAWANALIVVSEATSSCEAGERVEVIPFREL